MTSHSKNSPSHATIQQFASYPGDMWRAKDGQIASMVGCSVSTVSRVRRALGKCRPDGIRRLPRDCDWSKPDHELAAQHGVFPGTVSNARRKYSPDHKPRGKLRGADVPWELSNKRIAELYGLVASAVRKYRVNHNKPAPVPQGHAAKMAALDWTKVDLRRSIRELTAELGCSSTRISKMRLELGIVVPGGWRHAPTQAKPLPKPRKSQAEKAAEKAADAARLKLAREAWL